MPLCMCIRGKKCAEERICLIYGQKCLRHATTRYDTEVIRDCDRALVLLSRHDTYM